MIVFGFRYYYSIMLVVSLGKLSVSSNLINSKIDKPKVRDLHSLSLSEHEIIAKMRNNAYESYEIKITQVQVILSDANSWKKDVTGNSSEPHILHPISCQVVLERCIIDNDPHLAKMILKGILPEIEVSVSDIQMKKLMRLLLTLPFGIENQEDQMTGKTQVDSSMKEKRQRLYRVDSQEMIEDAMNLVTKKSANVVKNETDSTLQADGSITFIPQKMFKFDFTLKKILLLLFEGESKDNSTSLASALLEKFSVNGEMFDDGKLGDLD